MPFTLSPTTAGALRTLAAQEKTPLYVYDVDTVIAQCTRLRTAFAEQQDTLLLYALKANNLPPLVRAIVSSGFGLECVSLGEVLLAMAVAAPAILYTSTSVSDEEWEEVMALAVSAGVEGSPLPLIYMNVDSVSRLHKVPVGSRVPLWLRVNGPVGAGHHGHVITCGPSSKFGVPHELLHDALRTVRERRLSLVGLHQHIGSGVLDPAAYLAAVEVLAGLVEGHAASLPDLRFVDFGGGLGVPYRPEEAPLDLATVSSAVRGVFERVKRAVGAARSLPCPAPLTLVLEPGRYLVAEAGYLLVGVNTIKETPYYGGRTYAGVDSGFNHLVRPTMYGSHHEVTLLGGAQGGEEGGQGQESHRAPTGGATPYVVVGNICESGDVFTPAGPRAFPRPLVEGDVLVIHTVGAYGRAMASEYNLRPTPAEVLLLTGPGAGEAGAAYAAAGKRVHSCGPEATAVIVRPARSAAALVQELLG